MARGLLIGLHAFCHSPSEVAESLAFNLVALSDVSTSVDMTIGMGCQPQSGLAFAAGYANENTCCVSQK